jgi:hypothetical protein
VNRQNVEGDAVKRKRMTLDWMDMGQGLNNIDRNQGNGKEESEEAGGKSICRWLN